MTVLKVDWPGARESTRVVYTQTSLQSTQHDATFVRQTDPTDYRCPR